MAEKKIKANKKSKKVEKKTTKKKDNFWHGIKVETSKVNWPEAKDVIKYSLATLIMCVFIGIFFQLLEFLSSLIKGLI